MKMRLTEEKLDDEPVYLVGFEYSSNNGVHEAHVAVNAIAAKNRANYDKCIKTPKDDKLRAATCDLLNSGVDVFISYVQRQARDKSREGVLTDNISARGSTSSLEYLYRALFEYREASFEAVIAEMPNSMGNMTGLARTFEAVTASRMLEFMCVELDCDELTDYAIKESVPIGFGRALVEPDPDV